MNMEGTIIFMKNLEKDYPFICISDMEALDENNTVFSLRSHPKYGPCVLKFLGSERNIQRFINKIYPAI